MSPDRPLMIVSASATASGAERAAVSLARALPLFGYAPFMVLLEQGPLEKWAEEAGCEVEVVDAGRVRDLPRSVNAVRRLRRLVSQRRPAAVLSNSAKAHLYGGMAALASVPAVVWQHGLAERTAIDVVASRIPRQAVACVSEEGRQAQVRLFHRDNVTIIHPGLPIDEIAASAGTGRAVRRGLDWDENIVVGIVGRLQPWKGQTIFLEAAATVATRYPSVRFLIVGGAVVANDGAYEASLVRMVDDLGLESTVRFVGHQTDVYQWTDALDIVVHASSNEPFGLVVLEGMALGKPVIATNTGGPTEMVEDGSSGLLIPALQAESLANAIMSLVADPKAAQTLGKNAAMRALHFSNRETARQFAALLDGLELSGARGR